MHLVLTDVLTCPRCGPPTGLIVLADRMAGRRVVQGRLGCPNCQSSYGVREGVADLRLREAVPAGPRVGYEGDPVRMAALAGLTEARGFSLLVGPGAALAEGLVTLVPNLQLVVITEGGAVAAREGLSPLLVDGPIPLQPASMRAVIVTGSASAFLLRECARVVAGGGRVVIEGPSALAELVEASGLQPLVAEGNTIVATRAM